MLSYSTEYTRRNSYTMKYIFIKGEGEMQARQER